MIGQMSDQFTTDLKKISAVYDLMININLLIPVVLRQQVGVDINFGAGYRKQIITV
jgi:hypothetical protein